MEVAALIGLVTQVLPLIAADVPQVIALFDSASTAIKNAQSSGNGLVAAADWQAVVDSTTHDLAQLAIDAGVTPPT